MRYCLLLLVLSSFVVSGSASAGGLLSRESQDRDSGYVGGRGLITESGQTGLFLNPTSGTHHAGDVILQSCALFFEVGGETVVGHGVLAGYGVTDWLDVGIFGLGIYGVPKATGGEFNMGAVQGNIRARVIRDEGLMPEVSVGGMYREGNGRLDQRTLFIAASKGHSFANSTIIKGVRLHVGFRQIWQNSDFNEDDGSIVYGGGEINLPENFHIVGEISNTDDIFAHTPFAIGMQWRHPKGYGVTLSYTQPGNSSSNAIYAGIGVNF